MKTLLVLLVVSIGLATLTWTSAAVPNQTAATERSNSVPVVASAATAIRIAEVLLVDRYGESVLRRKPFVASELNKSTWVVKGTLPANSLGGVPEIHIRKRDCCVVYIGHGK